MRCDAWFSPAGRRCIAALEDGRPAPPAVLERSDLHEDPTFVLAPGHDPAGAGVRGTAGRARAARLARRCAHPEGHPRRGAPEGRRQAGEHARLPAIRADPFCVPELDASSPRRNLGRARRAHAAAGDPRAARARRRPRRAVRRDRRAARCVAPGLGGELKPFQRAGVSYLLAQRRAFLADEQGLGKTIEALATLEADGAYPAIVVCPASLKLNWLRELERWLPGSAAPRRCTGNARDALRSRRPT
jgi:hypothetical protein